MRRVVSSVVVLLALRRRWSGRGRGRPGGQGPLQPRRPGLRRRRARRRSCRPPADASGCGSTSTAATSRRRSPSRPDGRYLGAARGPDATASNVVTARAPGGRGARSRSPTTRSAARSSPARRSSRGRASTGALDAQCNRAPRYEFLYKPTRRRRAARRTTRRTRRPTSRRRRPTRARTVPFIVRQEIGALDRDEYRIAVLYDPAKPFGAVGAAGRLQPQARDLPRRELRHGATSRPTRPTCSTRPRSAAASRRCRTRSTTPATTATSPRRPSR